MASSARYVLVKRRYYYLSDDLCYMYFRATVEMDCIE